MSLDLAAIVEARDPNRSRRRPRRGRRMRGVGPRRMDEIVFRRELVGLSKFLAAAAQSELFALLERLESEFTRDAAPLVADAFGEEIEQAFTSIRGQFASIQSFAETRAQQMAGRVDAAHSRRHFEQVKQTVGVDLRGVVNEERLQSVLRARTRANVGLIKSIPEQYFQKLEAIVFESTIQGRFSAKNIQQQIRELGLLTERRAKFIARDQTAKLNSALNTERNLALGIEEYIWRTSLDSRVRPTAKAQAAGHITTNHREKEGKTFRFDSPPADTGHPGEDFNCLPGLAEIDLANGCHKLWRRFYRGNLVSIATADGALLEATPNHPILTSRGWCAIDDLREGDHLVKRSVDGELIEQHDEQRLVTRFDDLFEAASQLEKPEASRGTALQFHGDGTESDVDVVRLDGLLWRQLNPEGGHRLDDLGLSGAEQPELALLLDRLGPALRAFELRLLAAAPDLSVGGRSQLAALFRGELGHANEAGGGQTALLDPVLRENSIHDMPGYSEMVGDLDDTLTRLESIDDLEFGKVVSAIMRLGVRVGAGVERGVVSADCLAEAARMASQGGGSVFQLGAVRYQLTRVVEKAGREFASHVYNLENDHGFYSANGLMVHNCRCTAQSIIPDL